MNNCSDKENIETLNFYPFPTKNVLLKMILILIKIYLMTQNFRN